MQTELTFAQRMSQVMRRTQAAQLAAGARDRLTGYGIALAADPELREVLRRFASCRVARLAEAAPQRPKGEHTPNTYPHDLPVLNSKGN